MLSLRDYQTTAKQEIKDHFRNGVKRLILCLPTGAGKTVTFVDICHEVLTKHKRVIIICDRKELITQAQKKVESLGILPTIIAPGHKQIKNNCYLASVDTLRRRDIPDVDLVIIDEAHKQSFDSTIKRFIEKCDPFIIGATATPLRTSNQTCLSTLYDVIVEPVTISDLIDKKYLVPAKTYAAKEDYSSVKKRGSDYDLGELFKEFNKTKLYDGVIENYLKFAEGTKALCFNVNVEHSMEMCKRFNEAGISAKHIDGNTPKLERELILKEFEDGLFFILCNCSILTTGYDEPSIRTIIVNRATMSLALMLQMCGRGSRLFDDKESFIIIDQGANVYKHGLWQQDREWSLTKQRKRKSDGVAPVKLCPKCEEINFNTAKKCKSCGHVFEVKEKKLAKAEFTEVTDKLYKRGVLSKPDPSTATRTELIDYGKKMGYNNPSGWAHIQLKINKRV